MITFQQDDDDSRNDKSSSKTTAVSSPEMISQKNEKEVKWLNVKCPFVAKNVY